MLCPRCRTNNPEGSANCFKCGQHINEAPRPSPRPAISPAAPAPPPQPQEYGKLDIAGSILHITDSEITFEGKTLQTQAVTGIRYGIYKHYVNGIRTSRSYCVWLTDGESEIEVECAKGFMVLNSTVEKRFEDTIKALWPAVVTPSVCRLIDALASGEGFSVGDVTFDRSGLHRPGSFSGIEKGIAKVWHSVAGGKSAEQREREYHFLPWTNYGGHTTASGKVTLHRGKEHWASFSLRDTWNAVCLDPMFSYLYEDGRLWNFVDR